MYYKVQTVNSPKGKSEIEKMEMEIDDSPKPKGTTFESSYLFIQLFFLYCARV